MKIIGVRWTAKINMLAIRCGCGRDFEHRADRWRVRCRCGAVEDLGRLRERVTWI